MLALVTSMLGVVLATLIIAAALPEPRERDIDRLAVRRAMRAGRR